MLARVVVEVDQRPGSVFVPMHWSDMLARSARADALVNPALDPVSGQPEFKHTPVRVRRFDAAWHGFVLSRMVLDPPGADYCVEIPGAGHRRYELAGRKLVADWPALARALLGESGEWLELTDPAGGRYRGARLVEGEISGCLFVAPGHELPGRGWLAGLFAEGALDAAARAALLAGRPPRGRRDGGETLCACFGVGRERVIEGVTGDGLATVEAIGVALQAGTNCGSCLPELERLLAGLRVQP